jgi:hypothetical protein
MKEFEYYYEFYKPSVDTITTETTSSCIGSNSEIDQQDQQDSDSDDAEAKKEEVKGPDKFMLLCFAYLGMLMVCTVSSPNEKRVRRCAHNVDSNRQAKRRHWMNHYIERIFIGDPFLVDRAMIDVLKHYKYEERQHVVSSTIDTKSVSQFQLLAQGKSFSQQFSQTATRLDIGDTATKIFVKDPTPVCAQRPTPFMRISFKKQPNEKGEIECLPYQYENIGMAHHLLQELQTRLQVMIADQALIQPLFATLITQSTFTEKVEKETHTWLHWFVSSDKCSLEDFFFNWSPEYKCKDTFWNDFQQQPKLSEKLVRLLHYFVSSIDLLVSTYINF